MRKTRKTSKKNYEIRLEKDGASIAAMAIAAVVLGWTLLYMAELSTEWKNSSAFAVRVTIHEAVAITAGIVLMLEWRKKKRKGRRIWVAGEQFTIGVPGEAGKTYCFTEITKVKPVQTMEMNGRGGISTGKLYYQIYVGRVCVVALHMNMENAWRFIEKANSSLRESC